MGQFQITGLKPNVQYRLQVVAVNASGESQFSPTVSFNTPGAIIDTLNSNTTIRLGGGAMYAGGLTTTGVVFDQTGITGFKAGASTFYISAATGDANFAGTITSSVGKIGNWTISSSALYNGSVGFFASNTYNVNEVAIFAGSAIENRATSPFRVTYSGNMVAQNASITGNINANTGYVGDASAGWLISSSGLYNTTTKNLLSDYDPAFNSDFTRYWTFSVPSGAIVSADSSDFQNPPRSVRLYYNFPAPFAPVLFSASMSGLLPLTSAASYALSYYAKPSGTTGTSSIVIYFYNSSSAVVGNASAFPSLTMGSWNRYTLGFVAPANTAWFNIRLANSIQVNPLGTYSQRWDSVQLEQVAVPNTATNFEVSTNTQIFGSNPYGYNLFLGKYNTSTFNVSDARAFISAAGEIFGTKLTINNTSSVNNYTTQNALQIGPDVTVNSDSSIPTMMIANNQIQLVDQNVWSNAFNYNSNSTLLLQASGGNIKIGSGRIFSNTNSAVSTTLAARTLVSFQGQSDDNNFVFIARDQAAGTNTNTSALLFLQALNGSSASAQASARLITYYSGSVTAGFTYMPDSRTVTTLSSSDYRLKENVSPIIESIQKIKTLRPVTFQWIDDPNHHPRDGFIAHELQEVMPYAVYGDKDAVNEFGQPRYQYATMIPLIPVLTAAVKDIVDRLESLEARVAALENK